MDAALTLKFSRVFRLTGGPFKIPFRAESRIAGDLNIPIVRARAVLSLVPRRDTGVQARDVGFEAGRAWGSPGERGLRGVMSRGPLAVRRP
jgi:hypothetical protein